MEQRIFQIALGLLPGVGPVKAKALVAHVGSVEGVFKETEKLLRCIPGVGPGIVRSLNRDACLKRAEQELLFVEKHGIDLYYYEEDRYPYSLKCCDDSPVVLFTRGNIDFTKKSVAVVGTRKATPYGKKLVKELVAQLAELDVQIVSGLAYGIDIEAHRSALEHRVSTVAVLGHGFDLIYPAAHKPVARQMLEHGGLITEFVSNSNGDTSNFPRRNRIVAGLCDATVVVESAVSGGSLITANMANDYNRDVFAFPGGIDQEYSKGCNQLIQQDKAHLITCAADLVRIMGWKQHERPVVDTQTPLFNADLTTEEGQIVTALRQHGETDIDKLSHVAQMTSGLLSVNLFNLELKGLIRSIPGKRYALCY